MLFCRFKIPFLARLNEVQEELLQSTWRRRQQHSQNVEVLR